MDLTREKIEQIREACNVDSECLENITKVMRQRQEVARQFTYHNPNDKQMKVLVEYFDHLNDAIKKYLAL